VAESQLPPESSKGSLGERLQELAHAEGMDFLALLGAADTGDRTAEARAIAFLRSRPEAVALLERHGGQLQTIWLSCFAGSAVSRLSVEARAEAIAKDLAAGTPSPLEELLIERVVLCWLQLHLAETQCAGGLKSNTGPDRTDFYDRLAERAHRRYLSAIRSLAQVRRLELPTLTQFNVATNQVNIAAAGPSD
jgi:hypothetical protein